MSKQSKQDNKFTALYFLEDFNPDCGWSLIEALPDQARHALIHLYPNKDFMERETWKMIYYYETHPEKRPRSLRHWTIALVRWLENAYLKGAFIKEPEET